MSHTDLIEQLTQHKTLGAAPREELAWLASHGTLRHLDEGEVLTTRGSVVEALYVILTGDIAIFMDRGVGRHKVFLALLPNAITLQAETCEHSHGQSDGRGYGCFVNQ